MCELHEAVPTCAIGVFLPCRFSEPVFEVVRPDTGGAWGFAPVKPFDGASNLGLCRTDRFGNLGEEGANYPEFLQDVEVEAIGIERCNAPQSCDDFVDDATMLCAGTNNMKTSDFERDAYIALVAY